MNICCNLITPPTTSSLPFCPIDCSCVTTSFTPTCYTIAGNSLCAHLIGINSSLCALQLATGNIPSASVFLEPTYSTCPPPNFPPSDTTLTTFAQAQVNFDSYVYGILSGTPTNLIVDGNNGALTTLSGITETNASLTIDSAFGHGVLGASIEGVSITTGTSTINATTPISVCPQPYRVRIFLYSNSPSFATGANISLIVNGTGSQTIISSPTLNSSINLGCWGEAETYYIPDISQSVTVTVQVTGWTSGLPIYFNDIVFEPLSSENAGINDDFNIAKKYDVAEMYNSIAVPFVITGGDISTTGLTATIDYSRYLLNGTVRYENVSSPIALSPSTTNYIFYDWWVDSYTVKNGNALPDETAMVLWEVITNSTGVTSTIDLRVKSPLSSLIIPPSSITGSQIENNTITASNLVNSGVTLGTYGNATHIGQFTVNAEGLITFAANVAITYPVTSVNSQTGVVSLGLGNLNNVTLSSPTSGQLLQYNGSNWVNMAFGLGNLSNVTLTSPTSGQVLEFNGTSWVNSSQSLPPPTPIIVGSIGAPAFGSSWAADTTTPANLLFWKTAEGNVFIQGSFQNVSGASRSVFVLPTGYIPNKQIYTFGLDATANQVLEVYIDSSGNVNFFDVSSIVGHVCGVCFSFNPNNS